MIRSHKTRMSRKSKAVTGPGGDPTDEVVAQTSPTSSADEGYQNLDNKYEAAGFALSTIFKNWEKTLIIVLTILFMIGLILLLLLPGYKCQTETRSFEKSPVNIPGKGYTPRVDYNYDEGMTYGN